MDITLGICARNEQGFIALSLRSLAESARVLAPEHRWRIHICINGSEDQTEAIARSWSRQNPDVDVTVTVLPKGNLVEAQRVIANDARERGAEALGFFDADIEVDVKCLPALVAALSSKDIRAAYAVSVPLPVAVATYLEKVMNAYDVSPTVFTPRRHLHGRAFIIRTADWGVPRTTPPLCVDDIYISFSLLLRYGPNSIQRVPQAIVRFKQITTYGDFYRVYRRRNLEVQKCLVLFPEFLTLTPEQVNRRFMLHRFIRETPGRQVYWLTLLSLRALSAVRLKLEKIFKQSKVELWLPSTSSKRRRANPLIVLIEGLDCSGKKTIAELVLKALTARGIAAVINMGPLASSWYNHLTRWVSQGSTSNFLRSTVYAMEGIGDRWGAGRLNADVVIQISSPYRSWAYASSRGLRWRETLAHFMQMYFVEYGQVWLLSAPYALRVSRHKNQVATGANHDRIDKRFFGEQAFALMDKRLEELLLKHSRIDGRFDTSSVSAEEASIKIVDGIIRALYLESKY